MKTKHTAGPWRQDGYGNLLDENGDKIITTGLALTTGYWVDEEPKANASLIAAAPELLEVLQEILGSDKTRIGTSQYDKAIAAIAKATGSAI